MKKPPLQFDESKRLAAVRALGLIVTPSDSLDGLVRLTAQVLKTPAAALTLLDDKKETPIATFGMPALEVPRADSLSQSLLEEMGGITFSDLHQNHRFARNPLLQSPLGFRFFAGVPVFSRERLPLGMLGIFDRKSRSLSPESAEWLEGLGLQATALLARSISAEESDTAPTRAEMERTLRESLERFEQVTANIDETIWMTDVKKNQMVYISPAYERTWGRTCESLYQNSLSFLDAIHPEDRGRVTQALGKQMLGTYDEEYRIVRPNGMIRWIRDRAFPVKDSSGNVYRVCGVARDITESKNSEERLHMSKRRLQLHTQSTPLAVIEFDTEGHITDWNPAAENIFGYNREQVLGRYWAFLIPGTNPPLTTLESFQTILGGKTNRRRLENITASGKTIYCDWYHTPLIDDHGVTIGLASLVQDVTEAKISSDALIQQQSLTQSILANIPYSVFWKDRNSVFLGCNDRFAKDAGLNSADEIIGKNDYDMPWTKAQSDSFVKNDQEIMATGIPQINYEESQLHIDGNEIIVITSKVPLRNQEGVVTGILGVYADVTDFKSAQKKIIEQQAGLVGASKMSALGEMSSGIAHEINNPLAVIHGKAFQLKRLAQSGNVAPEKIIGYVEKIETTAIRISKIVKALRTFARDADKDPFEIASMKIIVEETMELCRERYRYHDIDLRITMAEESPQIECRQTQIGQVLLNLLNNAHDAVENFAEKWVALNVTESTDFVTIEVSDSGPGIAPEIRDKIMNPFFTTKEAGKGTGLGLSIAKGIVEGHGGVLRLDPSPTHTCFLVRLPKRQSNTKKTAA